MFGTATTEPLPAAYLTSYEAWDGYMGQVWTGLFTSQGLGTQDVVVEVAPGSSLKIAMGLASVGFSGTLYVVDPCTDLLQRTLSRYREFLPAATIHGVSCLLAEAPAHLPDTVDLLVSNHPFDDMILSHGLPQTAYAGLFAWTASPSAQLSTPFIERWSLIKSDRQALRDAKRAIGEEWQHVIERLAPRTVIISQYASSAFTDNSAMDGLSAHAQDIIEQLKQQYRDRLATNVQAVLSGHKHYNNHYIGTQILNAGNWLVL